MTYRYTILDNYDDGEPRYEIDGTTRFAICVVEEEDIARLFCAAEDLCEALEILVERERAEAAASGLSNDEMTWLHQARRAIVKAKPRDA